MIINGVNILDAFTSLFYEIHLFKLYAYKIYSQKEYMCFFFFHIILKAVHFCLYLNDLAELYIMYTHE